MISPHLDFYTTKQAAKLSGLTIHMTHYLCREGLVKPKCQDKNKKGKGKKRDYTFSNVVLLRALGKLLSTGISVSKLKKGLRETKKDWLKISHDRIPCKYLVSNGKTLYFKSSKRKALIELGTGGQSVFAFVLELKIIRDEVSEQAIKNGYVKSAA